MRGLENRVKKLEKLHKVKEPEEAVVFSIEGMVQEDDRKIPLEEYKKLHPNKTYFIDLREIEVKDNE